jgi:ribonuclease D
MEIIVNTAQLNNAVTEMADATAIALDTESNSLHHYPEQLCLIQIATRKKVYVIDTIILKNIEPLRKILADNAVMKVIHGADYDIRSVDRHCGFRIRNLYDTYIAARFAGMTDVGLAALLRDLLGVSIEKIKRLQTADWGRRPLSVEAVDYAASDVRHLHRLQEILDKKLDALGRKTWAAEEFSRLEEIRYTPPDLKNAYLAVKGNDILDGGGLAVLCRIFQFREEEAVRQHRPPFFIMPDHVLVTLAASPKADLSEIPGLGRGLPRFTQGLQQALQEGLAAPPIPRPVFIYMEPMNSAQLHRLSRLKAWRASIASHLALDPSIIWPTPSLQRLAREPDTFDVEVKSSNVRRWQCEQFAISLNEYLKTKA